MSTTAFLIYLFVAFAFGHVGGARRTRARVRADLRRLGLLARASLRHPDEDA